MIDKANPNALPLAAAIELAQRVSDVPRFDAENVLASDAHKKTIEPLLCGLLDQWEDHVVPVLKAADPAFKLTDRSKDFASRIFELGPSGAQVIGYIALALGSLILKVGITEECEATNRDPDNAVRNAAPDLAAIVTKFMRREGDTSSNLLARRELEKCFGPTLIDLLRAGVAVQTATEAAAD